MNQFNYLRKADVFLRNHMVPWLKDNHPIDAEVCSALLEDAKTATKFVLPEGGRVLNDRLKGIDGLEMLRLPFESVLIEYQASKSRGIAEDVVGEENTVPYPRRIVLANEQEGFIFVYSIVGSTLNGQETWAVQPMSVCISKVDSSVVVEPSIKSCNETTVKGVGAQIVPIGTLFDTMYSHSKEEWAWADMQDEVLAVLELIEALSCSNVTHEPLPTQKLNKSQIRKGALPFDEYRVLVVKNTTKEYQDKGGTHSSPREHLRRGHIRNLSNGNRIWINSCVVNAGVGGRINKNYDMRKVA